MPPETIVKETELTTEQQTFLDFIKSHPFSTQKTIAIALDWYDRKGDPDTRSVRATKEDINKAGQIIGSSHGDNGEPGYFYIGSSIPLLMLAKKKYHNRAIRQLVQEKELEQNFLRLNPTITLPPQQYNIFDLDIIQLEELLKEKGGATV